MKDDLKQHGAISGCYAVDLSQAINLTVFKRYRDSDAQILLLTNQGVNPYTAAVSKLRWDL